MTRSARIRRSSQERSVEIWNRSHPPGSGVSVKRDDGTTLITVTRSAAWVLSGHTAVVLVQGISGCYLLDRVKPRKVEIITP